MTTQTTPTCDVCHQPATDLQTVEKQVCRQTHSSPAEYESLDVCGECLDRAKAEDADPDYQRAVANGWAD